MAKKTRRIPHTRLPKDDKPSLTLERATRLYRLLRILDERPQTRSALLRRLRLDMRGFYRDLDTLRKAGIAIASEGRRYRLNSRVAEALDRLPFPDPHLTLGQATLLARGRTQAHRLLKKQIRLIIS